MAKNGIKIIKAESPGQGFEICRSLLYESVTKKTVLFLSGGSTPKGLYELLAKEKKLKPGAAAIVDERYFPISNIKNQRQDLEGSNEKMIRDAGLIGHIENSARFYPVLKDKSLEQTVKDYDETVRFLLSHFPKSIGILGIGPDGHTAGLPPGISNFKFSIFNGTDLVAGIDNFPGEFKRRITLTFSGLSKLDEIIVLAFGEKKKEALEQMLRGGSEKDIPARFYLRPEIATKTVLITDQKL